MLRAMDSAGIDRTLLIPFPVVEDYRREHDLIADAVRSHPDRFAGTACLNPFVPENEFREGSQALPRGPRIPGAEVPAPVSGPSTLCPHRSDFLFETALDNRLVLVCHTGAGAPYALPSLFIHPARRFPDLRIVLGHAGGGIYALEAIGGGHGMPEYLHRAIDGDAARRAGDPRSCRPGEADGRVRPSGRASKPRSARSSRFRFRTRPNAPSFGRTPGGPVRLLGRGTDSSRERQERATSAGLIANFNKILPASVSSAILEWLSLRGTQSRIVWQKKKEGIEVTGTIIERHPGGIFSVDVKFGDKNHKVLAQIAGKLRKHRIRILTGDRVNVELSPYDLARGRIMIPLPQLETGFWREWACRHPLRRPLGALRTGRHCATRPPIDPVAA